MATRIARVTLTIKLTAGKDDDIMNWLASLPKGERQANAKQLLREAVQRLHDDEDRLAQITEDTAWVREALTELPAWMEGLLSRIAVIQAPQVVPQETKSSRTGQLSSESTARREKRIAKAAW